MTEHMVWAWWETHGTVAVLSFLAGMAAEVTRSMLRERAAQKRGD